MEDLIKALQIFLKYANEKWPTNCSHDELAIMGIEPSDVSTEDVAELEKLGFDINEEQDYFFSYKYGSA